MAPEEFKKLGEAWGGRGWQTKLAKRLPSRTPGETIAARTVRRWLAGTSKIHPDMEARIRKILTPKPRKD